MCSIGLDVKLQKSNYDFAFVTLQVTVKQLQNFRELSQPHG